jgi:hypothetical protein
MRAMSWAVRVTFAATGRDGFLRTRPGGVIGLGPVASFYSKAKAEDEAERVRKTLAAGDVVTVIERSHGRAFPASPDDRTQAVAKDSEAQVSDASTVSRGASSER